MRCPICGLVVDGSEEPTEAEAEKGYTACNGCWAEFTRLIKAGEPQDLAYRLAQRVHHEAEIAKWDALQAKGRDALELEAKDNLDAMTAEARKEG